MKRRRNQKRDGDDDANPIALKKQTSSVRQSSRLRTSNNAGGLESILQDSEIPMNDSPFMNF